MWGKEGGGQDRGEWGAGHSPSMRSTFCSSPCRAEKYSCLGWKRSFLGLWGEHRCQHRPPARRFLQVEGPTPSRLAALHTTNKNRATAFSIHSRTGLLGPVHGEDRIAVLRPGAEEARLGVAVRRPFVQSLQRLTPGGSQAQGQGHEAEGDTIA